MESPLTCTTFAKLIKKLLKTLDNYNASDLTRATDSIDSNSSGEVAGIVINLGLHKIYDQIKDSRYVKARPKEDLVTIALQDYIELDNITDLDEVEAIMDTTNEYKLLKRSWWWYRKNYPIPANHPGVPSYYIRRGDRIYFAPRPSAVRTYTIDYTKFKDDLVLDNDVPLIPTQYDYWIIAEAMVEWAKMEDINSIPPILISERNDARDMALSSINADFDSSAQLGSHFNRPTRGLSYDRLVFED